MAEDTAVPKCKRGHLRTPDNVTRARNCKECQRLRQRTPEYLAQRRPYDRARDKAPERRAKHRIRQAVYNGSVRGWEVKQRSRLKGQREAIQAKLESLKKEEEEACRKLAALLIATKSSELGQST